MALERSEYTIDTRELFRADVDMYPVLNRHQQTALFEAYAADIPLPRIWALVWDSRSEEQDEELLGNLYSDSRSPRDALIISNLRLVLKHADKYFGIPYLDRVQSGVIGLINAVDHFDVERGFSFANFAEHHIKNAVASSINERYGRVSFTERTLRLLPKAYEVYDSFLEREGRTPKIGEWVAELCSRENVNRVTANNLINSISMGTDKVISMDQADGEDRRMAEEIQDESDTEATAIRRVVSRDLIEFISKSHLTKRQLQVIVLRYGLNGTAPRSQEEVAKIIGTTKENVSGVERYAFNRLRSNPAIARLQDK